MPAILFLLIGLLNTAGIFCQQLEHEIDRGEARTNILQNSVSAAVLTNTPPNAATLTHIWTQPGSVTFSTTLAPTTTIYEVFCQEGLNRTTWKDKVNYPDWYVQNHLVPFYAFKCAQPKALGHGSFTGTYIYDALVDKQTMEVRDTRQMCASAIQESTFMFRFDFFDAFYGLPNPVGNVKTLTIIYNQLIIYFSPLALFSLLFGLTVIRQFLRESRGSYLYVVHSTIVATDFLLYAFVALKGSRFQALVALPLCYTGNLYFSYAPDGFGTEILTVCIDTVYCINQNVQAALAFDRFAALFFPVWYKVRVTNRTVFSVVGLIIGINLTLFTLEFFSISFTMQALLGVATSLEKTQLQNLLTTTRLVARAVLFALSILAQVVFCSAILYAVLKRPSNGNYRVCNDFKNHLKACKLLYGTCLLSLVGGTAQCVSLVARTVLGYAGKDAATLFLAAENCKVIVTPICSSAGFYVHCCVSSAYRRIIGETAVGKAALKILSLRKQASVSDSSANSNNILMSGFSREEG